MIFVDSNTLNVLISLSIAFPNQLPCISCKRPVPRCYYFRFQTRLGPLQRPHWVEFPHRVTFISSNQEITGSKFHSCDSPRRRGKQTPFTGALEEYSEGDINMIMRPRHFLIHPHRCLPQMFLSVQAACQLGSKR